MSTLRTTLWPCLFAIVAVIVTGGCGEPEDDGSRNILSPNNSTATNADTNNGNGPNNATNNATTGTANGDPNNGFGQECADVVCEDPDRRCVKGVCVRSELKVACEEYQDLGEVDLRQMVTATGDTDGFADAIETGCGSTDGFSGAENAFRFTVPAPARVSFDLQSTAAIDWAIEVRGDDCGSSAAQVACSDVEQFDFLAEPGIEYFILVEPATGIDRGAFQIAMSFEELVCSPPASRSCDGDDLIVCQAGTSKARYGCGTGCSTDRCDGDTCDNVFEVTASASFTGDTQGFVNALDFASQPSCSSGGQQGIATPGPEIVLSLPGLTAGQTVTIDASMSDNNDNGIFVLDSCDDTSGCLASNDIEDILVWDVEVAGDYFVVIDKLTSSNKSFSYTVDID